MVRQVPFKLKGGLLKNCSTCQEYKSLSEFSKNSSKPDGLQSYCKACAKIFNKRHYESDKTKRRVYVAERNKKVVKENREFIKSFKGQNPCKSCGESETVCLDFHHLDPKEKDLDVSAMVYHKLENIKLEISKCIVLCSNCHRKVHAGILEIS